MHRFIRRIGDASARRPWTHHRGVGGRSPRSSWRCPAPSAARSSTTSPPPAARASRRWSCSRSASPRRPAAPPWPCSPRRRASGWSSTGRAIDAALARIAGVEHVAAVATRSRPARVSPDGRDRLRRDHLRRPAPELGAGAAAAALVDAIEPARGGRPGRRARRRRGVHQRRDRDLRRGGGRPAGRAGRAGRRVRHDRGRAGPDRARAGRGRRRPGRRSRCWPARWTSPPPRRRSPR